MLPYIDDIIPFVDLCNLLNRWVSRGVSFGICWNVSLDFSLTQSLICRNLKKLSLGRLNFLFSCWKLANVSLMYKSATV